jgi:hypothetical protein
MQSIQSQCGVEVPRRRVKQGGKQKQKKEDETVKT